MTEHETSARQLIERERHGVLCTISNKVAGWPFGSIVPYALTESGNPILLISELAEHTRNLRADSRCSLVIADSGAGEDPQAAARITLMGHGQKAKSATVDGIRKRYLDLFPRSREYFDVHDFSFFIIHTEHARFIGGFGAIHWLDPKGIFPEQRSVDPLAPFAEDICSHMNRDHPDSLLLYSAAFAGRETADARMTGIDSGGFKLEISAGDGRETIRIAFPQPVRTPDEVRRTMIEMLRQARLSSR